MKRAALIVALLILSACGDDGAATDAAVDTRVNVDADTDAAIDAAIDTGVDAAVDAAAPGASAGCGLANSLPTGEWVAQTIDVDTTVRDYAVWIPNGYDPDRLYPIVYQFHGCSAVTDGVVNNPPVEEHSGSDAILVRGRALMDCWDISDDGSGVALFDAMVGEVEASYCTDLTRRLATGYSSGSFMAHRLGCVRGDMLRGVATIAGGQVDTGCVGTVAALLIHDEIDSIVPLSASEGARDTHLARNGCDVGAPRTPTSFAPCETYAGCDAPVVWCQTSGLDHSRQDHLSAPAFWDFLSNL